MKNAGHITEEDCISYMKDFVNRSTKILDTWELSKFNEKTYLIKKVTRSCSCKQDSLPPSDDLSVGADVSEDDSSVVGYSNSQDIFTFEYHIIYSESYAVPVLYFNVYRHDGSLLSLPQVWELVPDHYRERLHSDKWTFLTQTEHPYLGRPFYQLHPCHTDKLMACVFTVDKPSRAGSGNYLIGWLCAVGPVVLLDMPFEYGGAIDPSSWSSICCLADSASGTQRRIHRLTQKCGQSVNMEVKTDRTTVFDQEKIVRFFPAT